MKQKKHSRSSSKDLLADDPLVSHVVYFDGKPILMERILGDTLRIFDPTMKARVRFASIREVSVGSGLKQTVVSTSKASSLAAKGADASVWFLSAEKRLKWSVAVSDYSRTVSVYHVPGLLLAHEGNPNPQRMLERATEVFDNIDHIPNVVSGFAAVGTHRDLGFGKCFTDICHPASWRTSVEELEWHLWEDEWTKRIRGVYWGTYLGPKLASKVPSSLFDDSDEFAAKWRQEPLIRKRLRAGGLALFLTQDGHSILGMDRMGWHVGWPGEPEVMHAAWLRVQFRKLGIL